MKQINRMRGCALLAATLCALAGCGNGEKSRPASAVAQPATENVSQMAPPILPSQPAGSAGAVPQAQANTLSRSTAPSEVQTVKITFAEGATVARIADTLEEKGVTDSAAFFEQVAAMDLSAYPLTAAILPGEGRCFRLEGYLFPDTYEFYAGESAESVLRRMLSNTEARITKSYRERAAELGLSMDEAIILASIIQKEAPSSQMAEVSSVLHNRLDAGMRLQCDVTITYVEGAIKPYISGDVNRYNSAYNTYKCAALPAGAICNPGLEALKAALWPADSDHLFFAFDAAGNYYYSKTYEEHLQRCEAAGIKVA